MTNPRNTALYACSFLLTPFLLSCSSPSDPGTFHPAGTLAPPLGPAATATSSTPPYSSAQINSNVLDRYRAFQDAYKNAYATADASGLPALAMDPLLTIITEDVDEQARKGVIWRFNNAYNPKVASKTTDGTSVVVLDCVRTIGVARFSAKTGKRLGISRGSTYIYQARFLWDGTQWKIAEARKGKRC
ncbi:hypothetical protein [Actinocorallia longicatena]|uniref:Mce-associated membrane protein n=1 Tax=Actinocorallia longicatena TaxID=111803 RepID=A0ABP6Q1J9_9ACTN